MGHRLLWLVLMLLVSCTSGSNPGDRTDARGQTPPVRPPALAGQPALNLPPSSGTVLPVPVLADPIHPGVESSDWPSGEESARPGDEGAAPEGPTTDEGPMFLLERLTSMYGVRVPLGNSRSNLDGIAGTVSLTVPISRSPVAGLSEFAREIIVSVSKKDLFVNDYRVGEVVCTTASGRDCQEGAVSGEAVTYHVRELEAAEGRADLLVVPALLKQLQYFQRGRSVYLSLLSEKAASWLMECDAYTLAVDRDIPFGIVATLVHTAGFADLTMARLAVVDDNDSLNYIPLPSPRLDRNQRRTFHLLGDDWWQQESSKQSVDFPYAWLAYSAALHAETFSGVEDPTIPACLPHDVMWDRAAEDAEYGRQVANQLLEYIDRLAAARPVLFGRLAPAPLVVGMHAPRLDTVAPGDGVDGEGTADAEGEVRADVHSQEEVAEAQEVLFPPNRVVPPVAGAGRVTAESPLLGPTPLIPQVFLQGGGFRVVLRTPDGTVITAVDVPLSEPDRLYHYLAQASGLSVQFSAAWDTPMEKVVAALDMLRYRCTVCAMSGRCRQWTPVLPHVLLFAVPGDRFVPLPAQAAEAPAAADAQQEEAPAHTKEATAHAYQAPAHAADPAEVPPPEPKPAGTP